MSIREMIEQPVVLLRKEVVYNNETYVLEGTPDANTLADSVLLAPERVAQYQRLWTMTSGVQINEKLVKPIILIHTFLLPPEGEAPFDVIDIAKLSTVNAELFFQLMIAVQGLVNGTPSQSVFDTVAAGNLEKPAVESNSNSTSGSVEADKANPTPSL